MWIEPVKLSEQLYETRSTYTRDSAENVSSRVYVHCKRANREKEGRNYTGQGMSKGCRKLSKHRKLVVVWTHANGTKKTNEIQKPR